MQQTPWNSYSLEIIKISQILLTEVSTFNFKFFPFCLNNKLFKSEHILKQTLSASIKAPASITNSNDSSSLTTAAVKPAADDALPEV